MSDAKQSDSITIDPKDLEVLGLGEKAPTHSGQSIPLVEVLEMDPYLAVDPFYVAKKDPNFYYCWLNTNPNTLQRNKDLGGYIVVDAKSKGSEIPVVAANAAGEYRVADLVLAKMPMTRYNALEELRIRRTREQIETSNAQFIEAQRSAGLKPFDETKIETVEERRGR